MKTLTRYITLRKELGVRSIQIGRLYLDVYRRDGHWMPGVFWTWNIHQTMVRRTALRTWFWWSGFKMEIYRPGMSGREIRRQIPPLFLEHRFLLMCDRFWERRLRSWSRRSTTVNAKFDPTVMIQWKWRLNRFWPGRVRITLIGVFEVEAKIYMFGRECRFYNHRFFNWMFSMLENAYHEREARDYADDPFGGHDPFYGHE